MIDTGGRNRLIYYRHLRAATLDLGEESDADPDAIDDLLSQGRTTLSALFPHALEEDDEEDDPPDEDDLLARRQFADALRRTKAIRRKAREHDEEQGIQTLYLAFGFATWNHSGPGSAPNAPILLSAAELDQRGRLDADFGLIISDEWELNPTLLHILRTEFGAQFDEQELDELAQPLEFDALTAQLERICAEIPGFRIRDGIVLSTFSYAKLPMVRDLQQASAAVANHPLVGALAGDEAAKDNLRAMYAPGGGDGEFRRPVPPAEEFLILDADGTQSEAINSARAGNHLVIVGPPGTGKSQTISNLIASLAADGKSVLFVAEKRAAIDAVTKRLNQVGLTDLVFDLHTGTRSRRQIAQQLADALAVSRAVQPVDTSKLERTLVHSRDQLTNVNEALHQPVPPWDTPAYELQGRLLGVKEADRTDLRILKATLSKLAGEEVEAAREALRDCAARQLGIASDGPWHKALERETLKDIGEADDALDAIGLLLGTELPNLQRESAALAVAMDEPRPKTLTENEALARNARNSAEAAIERQVVASKRERVAERAVPETTGELLEAEEEARLSADELAETKAEHQKASRARSAAAKPFTDAAASTPTSELARIAQQTALLRGGGLSRLSASLFKRGRYQAAQRALPALFAVPPPDLQEALDLLDVLVKASRAFDGSHKRLKAAEKAAIRADEILDLVKSEHRDAESELAAATTERETAAADCERWAQINHEPLARAVSAVRAPLRIAARHAAISKPGGMDIAVLERELRALEHDSDGAYAIAALQQARLKLQQIGIAQFADAAKTADWDADKAVRVFDHAWLNSVYRAVRRGREEVAGFDAEQHDAALAEFRASDVAHIAAGAPRVKRLWGEGTRAARNSHHGQAEIITREARKVRRHLAMRELFRRAPDVLTALKPCWAMSPLVVAQLLPASPPPFDVVIFDEASQIPPADAISSLLRGRQAIVAGDPKQLPPTAFFTQSGDDDDEREDADEELLTDDVESILDAMSTLLSSPRANKSLGWHYRSKDERLIAFANHHVYDGRMTTFPGALGDDCISHVEVPFSPRAVQQRGSNSAEVERVVQLILEHARERPGESLGVIAFGSHHAIRIEETLLQARRERPDLDEFFSESAAEPFFVKNLERVQGDERDAIILSVGYGRGADGRMRYAFGPINQEGGYRRLNVAITRAKRRMTVVSAFSPQDLDPDRIRTQGPGLLRAYIAYAASRGADLGRVDLDKPPLNDFERDIKRRLEAEGIRVEPQYGASGYRIDFAAFHPEQPGRPVLAIEADGAAYHSAPSARDRDRLRQEHLERLGWRFHRIWSTEYFRRPEQEIARAVAAWQSAVAAADAPEPEPAPEPVEPAAPAAPDPPPPQPQRGPKPNVGPKRPITEFSTRQIREIIDWVDSDGILRTQEETIQEVSRALGFQRRGSRIDAAISNALLLHRRSQPSESPPESEDQAQPPEPFRFTTRF